MRALPVQRHGHSADEITRGILSPARLPSTVATQDDLAGKSDADHTHDDRYYTETEMDTALAGKSDVGHAHDASAITSGTLAAARLPSPTAQALSAYLASGWTDYGFSYQVSVAWKSAGMVTLAGLIERTGASITGAVTLLTLPAGFYPASRLIAPAQTSAGLYRLDVNSTGDVLLPTSATWNTGAWISLAGISFAVA